MAMKRDSETGTEYLEITYPKYAIGDVVIYPSYSAYQAEFEISLPDGRRVKNQLIMGTIIGCTYNPDSGTQWKYFIQSPVQPAPQGDAVFEKDIILIKTEEVVEKPAKK